MTSRSPIDEKLEVPTVVRPSKPALHALTGLRFWAALAVFSLHFLTPDEWGVTLPAAALRALKAGWVDVTLFFVLSGFILAYAYEGMGSSRVARHSFWTSRIARLYPVHLLGLIWVTPFIYSHRLAPLTLDARILDVAWTLLPSLVLVQAWFHPRMINWNGPAWSLSAEAAFYLLFPIVMVWIQRGHPRRPIILLIASWTASCLTLAVIPERLGFFDRMPPPPDHVPPFYLWMAMLNPVFHMASFLSGVALGTIFNRRPARPLEATLLAVVALASVGATMAEILPERQIAALPLLIPLFGLLIYGLASGGLLSRPLSHPWMVRLGEASYAFYVLQYPVVWTLEWTREMAEITIPDGIMFLLCLVTAIGISILVYHLWETPLRAWIRTRYLAPVHQMTHRQAQELNVSDLRDPSGWSILTGPGVMPK